MFWRFRFLSLKGLFLLIAVGLYLLKLFWWVIVLAIFGSYFIVKTDGFSSLSKSSYKQILMIGLVVALVCFVFFSALDSPSILSAEFSVVAWWGFFTYGLKLKTDKRKKELKESGVTITKTTNYLSEEDRIATYVMLFSFVGIIVIAFTIPSMMPDEYYLNYLKKIHG